MLFTQPIFLLFFIGVYLLYLRLGHRGQNRLLLLASYVFYGWWDVRFLVLLLVSTIVDFRCGRALAVTSTAWKRKGILAVSVAVNLGILGFFKYCDFFLSSTAAVLEALGFQADVHTLGLIVPVGISFYTFQTLSYTIDVYRGAYRACDRLGDFALYVCFFPQLVAGPIERPGALLGQIERPRYLRQDQVLDGLFLILQGYFLKMLIADSAAPIANTYFAKEQPTGLEVIVGAYAFAMQIYGDFAGYSRIARGLARVMGFELMQNFRRPYFAVGPSDFWKRWHISLSSWLRDYLYIPLGGNRKGPWRTRLNLVITMLLGGLWHGPAWHFVAWGAFHGGLLVTMHPLRRLGQWAGRHAVVRLACVVAFFQVTCVGWIIFRAPTTSHALRMLRALGHWPEGVGRPAVFLLALWPQSSEEPIIAAAHAVAVLMVLVLLVDLTCAAGENWHRLTPSGRWRRYTLAGTKTVLAGAMVVLIFLGANRYGEEFIYFQF